MHFRAVAAAGTAVLALGACGTPTQRRSGRDEIARGVGLTTTVAPSTTTTPDPPLLAGAPAAPVEAAAPVVNQVAPCRMDQVTVEVVVGGPIALVGQPVSMISRALNHSATPCRWPGDVRTTWRDAKGLRIERARTDVQPATVVWEAGQVLEERQTWDQHFADGTTAAIGAAQVAVSWGPAGENPVAGSATFTIATDLTPPTTAPPR
ncbi:MAG: hypothetical protein NVS3B21_07180 [Acidimicrobiales bacterium]